MSLLNLEDLYYDQEKRTKNNNKVYDVIVNQCHRKIQKVNSKLKLFECYYQIPRIIHGYPLFDMERANAYLRKRLTKNGLLVYYLDERTLYLSWKPEDIDYERYQKSLERETDKTKYQVKPVNQQGIPTLTSYNHNKTAKQGTGKAVTRESLSNDGKVAMIQYDPMFDDIIPVNTNKIQTRNGSSSGSDEIKKFPWET